MKNGKLLLTFLLWTPALVFIHCGEKKSEEPKEKFLPVTSILRGQLKDIDTSLYSIIKVSYTDNIPTDTQYIRREDVAEHAKEFLEIPEISHKTFTEESIPGPTEGLSTITYKPITPADQEVQRADVILDYKLSGTGQNVVKSIYIERGRSNRDSAVQSKLLWLMDRSFQVTRIVQRNGQEEVENTYRVIWNDAISQ